MKELNHETECPIKHGVGPGHPPSPLPREARSNIPLIYFSIDPYQLESNSPANNSLSFSHLYAFLWVKYELTVHKSGVVHCFIHS